MLSSALLPGASFSSNQWVIPVSSLNSVLANDIVGKDSIELLIHSLLSALDEAQTAGAVKQVNCAAEVSNRSLGRSTWEESQNVFSNCVLSSFLVSFNLSTSPSESGNDITTLPAP